MQTNFFFRSSLFLALFLLIALSLSAQNQTTISSAVLMDDFTIVLNENAAFTTNYKADASHYANKMIDQKTAESFFKNFERDNVSCSIEMESKSVKITLSLTDKNRSWSLEEWNEYLKSKK